jgi:phosphoserine phosphatase RsbX
MAASDGRRGELQWSASERPLPGEARSGDLHLVSAVGDRTLLAVIDGLGHGTEAYEAARRAAAALTAAAAPAASASSPTLLEALFERCHTALRATRGVVMTLVLIDGDGQLRWAGVGNVEGAIVHGNHEHDCRERILLRPGVVGLTLPALRPETLRLRRGDLLVLVTDGIRHGFLESLDPRRPVQAIASQILAEHARPGDDALVLVARYGQVAW